jgi:hypothetical protein
LPPGYEDFTYAGNFKSGDTYGSIQLTFCLNKTHTVAELYLDDGDGLRLLVGVDSDLVGDRPSSHPFELQQILAFHQHLDAGYVLLT